MFYQDQDGDGFGGSLLVQACSAPAGFVSSSGDCQDFNANIHPDALEACNQIDDNCNGEVDEEVVTRTLYWDNDGDGFAPINAPVQQSCNASAGWVPAKDTNGDGEHDWDCNDSDTTTYPGAPEVCGDARDNGCSGYIDRICYNTCNGQWPFRLANSNWIYALRSADLNGDGQHEVFVQDSFGFAILDRSGSALFQHSTPVHNHSRGPLLVADIDDYDQYGPSIQTLEILTGNGSNPRFYKLREDGSVAQYMSSSSVYDASTFLASDLDRDGRVEFFTGTWCEAEGTRIFRFNRATGAIELAASVSDPQGQCEFWSGRTLTDLDGDGNAEFVFSNGNSDSYTPSRWSGNIYAYRIDPATLSVQPYCAAGTCFPTTIAGLHGGAVYQLIRFGGSLRAHIAYFSSNVPGELNSSEFRSWEYNQLGDPTMNSPMPGDTIWQGITDVDRNGVPESFVDAATIGLFDVNGDGYPDRLYATGSELRLSLWDPSQGDFVENVSSRARITNSTLTIHSIWDLDADGRLDVLASDADGNVHCQELGFDTWNKSSSVPPLPIHLRTNQWDNYEPNEGTDHDGDGIPDDVVRIPSALTAKGDFYGYLSSANDKDYYLLDTNYQASICVTAPTGKSYTVKIYSFADLWNNTTRDQGGDGIKDGLIWEDSSSSQTKCFHGARVAPPRWAEYKFILGIEATGDEFSAHWPYWVSAPK